MDKVVKINDPKIVHSQKIKSNTALTIGIISAIIATAFVVGIAYDVSTSYDTKTDISLSWALGAILMYPYVLLFLVGFPLAIFTTIQAHRLLKGGYITSKSSLIKARVSLILLVGLPLLYLGITQFWYQFLR